MLNRMKPSWLLVRDRLVARSNKSNQDLTGPKANHSKGQPASTQTSPHPSSSSETNQEPNNRRSGGFTTEQPRNGPLERRDLKQQGELEGTAEVTAVGEFAAVKESTASIDRLSFVEDSTSPSDFDNSGIQKSSNNSATSGSTANVLHKSYPSVSGFSVGEQIFDDPTCQLHTSGSTNTLQLETSNEEWTKVLKRGSQILDAAVGGCELQLQIFDGLTNEGKRCSRIMDRLSTDVDHLTELNEAEREREAILRRYIPPTQVAIDPQTHRHDHEHLYKPQKRGLRLRKSMSILSRPSTWFRRHSDPLEQHQAQAPLGKAHVDSSQSEVRSATRTDLAKAKSTPLLS